MIRDSYDMFNKPERGRFGDDERADNQVVKSNLHDFTLLFRYEKPLAIAVSEAGGKAPWIWLPRSEIQYEKITGGMVKVTMPEWLAVEKGLL